MSEYVWRRIREASWLGRTRFNVPWARALVVPFDGMNCAFVHNVPESKRPGMGLDGRNLAYPSELRKGREKRSPPSRLTASSISRLPLGKREGTGVESRE